MAAKPPIAAVKPKNGASPRTGTLAYHNFSIGGDPRWADASKWTRRAPVLMLCIWVLSIIETALGAIWIVQLQSAMTVPKILQPLILPGLSFFHALPSLHLHMLARGNPPVLALFFSTAFAGLWTLSTLLLLVSCRLPVHAVPLALRQTECSTAVAGVAHGPGQALWWVVVVLGLLFAVLYAEHAVMAWYVMTYGKTLAELDVRHGAVEMLSEEERERARRLWAQSESCNA